MSVQYTWTEEAFATLPPGIEPYQIMRTLRESRLLRIWYATDVLAVFGRSPDGVYMAVFLSEDDQTDGVEAWLIEGARAMFPSEIRCFRERLGGTDA